MREAGLEEMENELNQIAPPDFTKITSDIDQTLKEEMEQIQAGMAAWTTPPSASEKQVDDDQDDGNLTSDEPAEDIKNN
jgi:hypothetical protein